MIHLLLKWLASAISLLIVAYFVPGFRVSTFTAALIAAVALGLINGTLGAILKFFTFPVTILTLGIFSLVINALMLMLAASIVPGFTVNGFAAAFVGSILLSLVNWILGLFLPSGDQKHSKK
jgi:putative membrane protein